MSERIAIYAGSFDPITNGHLHIINTGRRLVDKLIVAVGTNPAKSPYFSLVERMEMITEVTKPFTNVEVAGFGNRFLINYAVEKTAQIIIRGIRDESDYHEERKMWMFNYTADARIITVWLSTPPDLAIVSSSFVRGLIGPEGWEEKVQRYVPESVHQKLLEKHYGK